MKGRQADRYADQASPDSPGSPVFVRVVMPGEGADDQATTGEWLEVGQVSVAATASFDVQTAAQLQKRLILEHAVRLHPFLAQRDASDWLEVGVPEASDGEPVLLAAGEELPTPEVLQLAAACGFMSTPVPTHGHYWGKQLSANGVVGTDGRKVQLTGLGNDAKSAVAEQFSKQLGLRSG